MLFKKEPVRIAFSVVESFDENSYDSDNKIYQCNRDINSKICLFRYTNNSYSRSFPTQTILNFRSLFVCC